MEYLAMMRTETFEVKVKECATAAGFNANNVKIAVDPIGRCVGVELNDSNGFKVTGSDLGVAYEHAIRILKGYGPKCTRNFKKKDKASE